MATKIKRTGFGQVEPNHLSAQRTGQIYAQLPAKDDIKILENGQFVKYDYAQDQVNLTGPGEWMLVFNEVKLYDDYRQTYKDFAMIKENYTPGGDISHYGVGPLKGQMVPRVFKTNIGDIYTTNCVGAANDSATKEYVGIDLEVGNKMTVETTGYLKKNDSPAAGEMVWQVVKIYTMADGQPAVKLMRIA